MVDPTEAWLPLSLAHLAGVTRAAGHACEVVDALGLGLGVDEVEALVRRSGPDVVCVTAATPGFPAALELCGRVRASGRTTVVGGVHASFMYPEFLPAGRVDFAVVGEGEETLPELLRCLTEGGDPSRVAGIAFALGGRVVRTAPRPRLAALDPVPKAWDLLPAERYRWAGRPGARMGAVATSRGCPRRCASCCHSAPFEGGWRARSVDAVAYELTLLRQEHDVDVVAFYDPAPTADPRRFADLVDRLVELDLGLEIVLWSSAADLLRDEESLPRWRQAGIVHVGICRDPAEDRMAEPAASRTAEEGSRAVRALRGAGIASEASFWIGFPDEMPGTVEATFARARAWDPDLARFPLLTPLPYTPAWRAYGAHVVTRDYRRYNGREPVVKPAAMELDEVAGAAETCRRRWLAGRPPTPGAGRRAGPWLVHSTGRSRPLDPAADGDEERPPEACGPVATPGKGVPDSPHRA